MVSFLTFFFSIECDLEWHMYSMLKKHSNWNVYNSTGPFKSPGTYRVYRGHRRETCLHCCIPSCLNAIKHSLFELKGNSHFSFQWNSSLYLSLHRPLHSSEVNVPVQLNRKETFPFRYPFFYFCSHLFAFVKKNIQVEMKSKVCMELLSSIYMLFPVLCRYDNANLRIFLCALQKRLIALEFSVTDNIERPVSKAKLSKYNHCAFKIFTKLSKIKTIHHILLLLFCSGPESEIIWDNITTYLD